MSSSESEQLSLPPTCPRKEGSINFPSLRNLYDFFTPRAKQISVCSIGLDYGGFEIDVIENTGCTVHIYDARWGAEQKYKTIERVTREHKTEDSDPDWVKPLADRWIPKNRLIFHKTLPYQYSGSINVLGELETYSEERLDILKLSYDEFNPFFLYNFINMGYRPGLIYIHWTSHPDESNESMLAAGHLQNTGYRLLAVDGKWFLYMYVNQNIYESVSWARTDVTNPMLEDYQKVVIQNLLVGAAGTTPPASASAPASKPKDSPSSE
jgi:hypothetical protein